MILCKREGCDFDIIISGKSFFDIYSVYNSNMIISNKLLANKNLSDGRFCNNLDYNSMPTFFFNSCFLHKIAWTLQCGKVCNYGK